MPTKTVFILGAGASMPYGFPSGMGLVKSIINSLQAVRPDLRSKESFNHPLPRILIKGMPYTLIDGFRNDLSRSQSYSIDVFLNNWPKYVDIGKMCIAYHLLEAEQKCLKEKKLTGDWYQHIWSKIYLVDSEKYSFSFYTFNYDRSLRYFFQGASKSMFQENEKYIKLLKSIPIHHLHGNLGMTEFGALDTVHNFESLRAVSENLKIIFEVDDMTIFNQLHDELKECNNIVFLGFGFHPDNLKRIGFPRIKFFTNGYMPNIYSSAFGLTRIEMNSLFVKDLRTLYNINFHKMDDRDLSSRVTAGNVVEDNIKFLREHFPFEDLLLP
ncbi:hypothetical protein [Draconibacterium halophilum]|uniref:SIR2-like domain-containing protein n=1 Tax=Draconibacterium halophilum TaxID=2706887 RepID=A0A6C0RB95_9BACT|nr:hypothetical protein [Draconibacterium halophilum]QIA06441.1 hypothetical protein G0Q07_01265 [Draconibacterium halophilum]